MNTARILWCAAGVVLGASSCRLTSNDALRVRITVDPSLPASCVRLDLLTTTSQVLDSLLLPRPDGTNELRVAVFRGQRPQALLFKATALVGTGCEVGAVENTSTALTSGAFASGSITEVLLELTRPAASDDADGDGYAGGPADCDDGDDQTHVGAPEECGRLLDRNCNGSLGCADAACAQPTCALPPAQLAFVTPERSVLIPRCSEAITVELRDVDGAGVTVETAFQLSIVSSLPTVSIYSDESCTMLASQLAVSPGSSTATFYLLGTESGSVVLTASAPDLVSATQVATLTTEPPVVTSVSLTAPATSAAGVCTPVEVAILDQLNNPASLTGVRTVTVSASPSPQGVSFYGAGCNEAIGSVMLGPGNNPVTVHLRGTLQGTATLSATATDLTGGSATVTITPGVGTTLKLPAGPLSVSVRGCVPVELLLLDDFGNPAAPALPASVLLSVDSANAATYGTPSCDSPINTLVIDGPSSTFYVGGLTAGAFQVDASAPEMAPDVVAGQVVPPPPIVRRGSCTLRGNDLITRCTISPAQTSLSRTLLIFQARSPEHTTAGGAQLSCRLSALDEVTCKRQDADGVPFEIHWQTAELPVGMTVRHFPSDCTDPITTVALDPAVDHTATFNLFSFTSNAPDQGSYNFKTTVLADSSVTINTSLANFQCYGAIHEHQLVSMDGIGVGHHATQMTGTDGNAHEVTGMPPVDPTRTFLLYSYRTSATGSSALCQRTVTGRITGPSTVAFTRGLPGDTQCTTAPLTVAFQRVELPPGASVRQYWVSIRGGATSVDQPITSVDPARTLVFAPGQGACGQSNGGSDQTSYASIANARATFELRSATQVRAQRGASTGVSTWAVQVVELPP